MEAEERARRLVGTVNGTILTAGVLAVSAADEDPNAFDAGLYALATVVVFWLAHGWAHSLGRRAAEHPEHRLAHGLVDQLPVLESVVPPLVAIGIARLLGVDHEGAITWGAWVCVAELGLLGAAVAHRERRPPLRIASTAAGCAALGLLMIVLKAIVH
jgi:hypothetical protein